MSDERLAIIIGGLPIFGGLLALTVGLCMYIFGAGRHSDHMEVTWRDVKIKARTVGTVLMATSFLWALIGVWTRPTYERLPDGSIRVSGAGIELDAASMVVRPTACIASVMSSSDSVRELFRKTIREYNLKPDRVLKLNGQPARYDANSVDLRSTDHGAYLARARAETTQSAGEVYFTVEGDGSKITFRPWCVTGTVPPKNGHNDIPPGSEEEAGSFSPEPLPLGR